MYRVSPFGYGTLRLLILILFIHAHFPSLLAQTHKDKLAGSKRSFHLLELGRFVPPASHPQKFPQSMATAFPKEFMFQEGLIAIETIAIDNPRKLERELKRLGAKGVIGFGRTVNAWLPLDKLNALEGLESLHRANPVIRPFTRVGSVTSLGDSALFTDDIRRNFHVNGFGIKIGTISDSYDDLGGEAAGIASGNLPGAGNSNGYTTPVQILDAGPIAEVYSDEGRAMIELIHDVAPGATHAFHTGFGGQADFASAIIELAAAGCNIIVDDVGYFTEPFFQDGAIAQAIDQVVNTGVLYFSAAGNFGTNSYETNFSDGGNQFIDGRNYKVHDFGGGDFEQSLTLFDEEEITLCIQWDDPWQRISGAPGADTDIDIFLIELGTNTIVDKSIDNNVGNDPVEFLTYKNTSGGIQDLSLVIGVFEGPNPGRIKYIYEIEGDFSGFNEHETNSSTIYGHANAAGALATGAIFYFATPEINLTTIEVNGFSSRGGLNVLFDLNGNPINSDRQKPDILSVDGANTSFFGQDINFTSFTPTLDPDVFPNFFGTSAAAPHAAGLAALLLQSFPATSPANMKLALQSTATDIDGGGYDVDSGFGLIHAQNAHDYLTAFPIEWAFFEAEVEGNAVDLSWASQLEKGLSGYHIEHSRDKLTFLSKEFIRAKGAGAYQKVFEGLALGKHYFRLRAEDFDGSETLSSVIEVEINTVSSQFVMIPKNEEGFFFYSPNHYPQLRIQLYDMMGQLVETNHENRTFISANALPQGMYVFTLEATGNGTSHVQTGKVMIGYD